MTIAKLSLGMPCTGPITNAGVLTLRGRFTSPYLRCHGPPLLSTKINLRSRTHGELHQIIYNKAFRAESDKRGKIGTGFECGKLIIGVLVGFCVIGAMSGRYKAQKELDMLMGMAIEQSKKPSNPGLESVKAATKGYSSGVETIDKLIDKGEYDEAERKCLTFKKEIHISDADSGILLREFIALIGQARNYLKEYDDETKSLQRMDEFMHELTLAVPDEFYEIITRHLDFTAIDCKIDEILKDLANAKIEGKDAFSKVPFNPQLETVKAASGEDYLSELKIIDKLLAEGKYEEAETKCLTLKENFPISDAVNSIAPREFIALIGQARNYLKEYVNKTKSQNLHRCCASSYIHISLQRMNEFIHELTLVVTDEFHEFHEIPHLNFTTIECKIDEFLKDLANTKIEGKDAFSKFNRTMKSAHEKCKEYREIEEEFGTRA